MCIVVSSSTLNSIRIDCFCIQRCFSALVVDVVWRVCDTLDSSRGRQQLGGVPLPDKGLGGRRQQTFALSIAEVTGLIHVNPEPINWNHLKEVANLWKRAVGN